MGKTHQLPAANRISVLYFIFIFIFHNNVSAQQIEVSFNRNAYELYLLERHENNIKYLDTMSYMFDILNDPSIVIKSDSLYLLCYSSNRGENVIFDIYLYLINSNKKMILFNKKCIRVNDYTNMRDKNVRIELSDNGICLRFTNSNMRNITLSYDCLQKNSHLTKILKKIDKLIE
jgi:hypothetical protein